MKLKSIDVTTLNNDERRVATSMYDGSCSLSEISCDTSLPYKTVIHTLNSLRDKGCLVFDEQNNSSCERTKMTESWSVAE